MENLTDCGRFFALREPASLPREHGGERLPTRSGFSAAGLRCLRTFPRPAGINSQADCETKKPK